MDKMMKRVAQASLALFACLLLPGCSLGKDDPHVPSRVDCPFTYSLDTMSVAATRSILTDAGIEDRVGSVTLAAYSAEGVLSASDHFSGGGVSSMRLDLTEGETYWVYALVNMGDMTDEVPSSQAAMESFVYEVPSYSDVNEKGLPMAGVLQGYLAGGDEQPVIHLRRLFAKVTADLALAYGDASITEVRVRNLNGRLMPFGEGAARSADDILADEEWSAASGSYGTYVFYVPENMQGTIGSAATSHDKNPDADDAIASAEDRLTYMEVDVALDGRDYAGNVTYRSFLGEDALKDFDVKGNYRYIWRVTYAEDNLQYDDWKIDTDGAVFFDYELEVVPGSLDLKVGQKGTLKAYHYRITDGVRGQATDVTSKAVWSSQRTAVAAVDAGEVTAKSQGTSVVTATYDGISATADVAVSDDIAYELEVTPSSAGISWNEEVGLTAMYYRITNGVRDDGTDVTSMASWTSSASGVATVTASGVVKGVKGGTATVTATYEGESASASITVRDVVEYELDVTPSSASISWNETASLKATYYTITNGVKNGGTDVTSSASWSSDNTGVATVSRGTVTGKGQGTAKITAAYSGRSDSASISVGNVTSHELVVTPASASVNWNETVSLKAMYYTTTNGVTDSGKDVTSSANWSSSRTGVATVTSSGVVKGVAGGTATVTATYSGMSDSASITVKDVVTHELDVTPSSASVSWNETVNLRAMYYTTTNGVKDSGTDVTSSAEWTSDNTSVASVTKGSVKGIGSGTTRIRASYDGYSDQSTVSVGSVITHELVVSPASASVNWNEEVSLKATYFTTTNGVKDGGVDVTSSASWKSSSISIATVSKGVVKGVNGGATTVTATYEGESASASITVRDVVEYELDVTPSSASISWNETASLKATYYTITNGVKNGGTDVTSSASWSSDNTGVATVSRGTVTGKGQGTAKITAAYSGKSDSASISVGNVTSHELVVTPASASVNWNETVSLKAMYYTTTNGVTDSGKDVTSSANWSSNRTGVATVTSSGVVKGVAGGTATVTATYSGMSATASITVKDVVTHEFVLSPGSASIDFGETVSLSALYYTTTNGKTTYSDVTASATWSRSGTALTSTGTKGEYVGENAGSSTVTATYQGHSASAVVTVRKEMSYRLEVDPSSVSLRKGDSQQIDAVYVTVINGEDYSTADVTSLASWSVVSGGSYAQVSNGLVTGRNVGSARVRAAYAGKSAEVAVTVTEPVVQSVTLSQTGTVNLLVSDYAQTLQLSAVAALSDGTEVTSGLGWKSGNTSVATVSSSGLVTPVGYGSTGITVSYTSGGVTKSASLTVRVSVMSMSPTESSISVGSKQSYTVTIINYSGNSSSATYSSSWESSDASVAKYVSYGQFTGVAAGTATVTASYDSTYGRGYVRASLSVTDVVTYKTRIEILGGSEVAVGKTMQLSVRRYTDTYTNGILTGEDASGVAVGASQVTWSVSVGTSYATVSAAGIVTGKLKTSSTLVKVKAVLKTDTSLYATKDVRVVGDSSVSPDPDWDDEGNIEL